MAVLLYTLRNMSFLTSLLVFITIRLPRWSDLWLAACRMRDCSDNSGKWQKRSAVTSSENNKLMRFSPRMKDRSCRAMDNREINYSSSTQTRQLSADQVCVLSIHLNFYWSYTIHAEERHDAPAEPSRVEFDWERGIQLHVLWWLPFKHAKINH